jgi:hypothetical protein
MTTSSVCKRLLDRLAVALVGATEAADRVFDSREVAIERGETPCIFFTPPDSEDTQSFAEGVDQNTALISLEVLARGEDWREQTDRIAVAAHRIVMSDPVLQTLVDNIRKQGRRWQGEDADQTAGSDSLTYRFTYLTLSNDMASTF